MKINLRKDIILLVIATLFIFPMVLNVLSVNPSIEITEVMYEVDDQGDLNIRLTGELTSISLGSCQFHLKIPEDFEIGTLSDGSPIIKIAEGGAVQNLTLKGTHLSLIFVVQTFNSTLLPRNYAFEMNSSSLYYSGFITPHWPQQKQKIQGGGKDVGIAASNPYITDFYAYDSDKGETEHVKTWIYNPAPYPKYLKRLRYKSHADDYDWLDWTQWYNENKYIFDYQTRVVHDYLDYIFTSSVSPYKKYALNIGNYEPNIYAEDYKVTFVYAEGTGWSDYYVPTSRGEFDVNFPGTHLVFVVYFTNDEWYDRLYLNPSVYIEAASTYFEKIMI